MTGSGSGLPTPARPAWLSDKTVLVVNPPVPAPTLAQAAERAGAIGVVDIRTTRPSEVRGALVTPPGPAPSGIVVALLPSPDEALARKLADGGASVVAVAANPSDCPSAVALVAKGATGNEVAARATTLLAGGRPVLAWGGLDRATVARLRALGVAGFVVDKPFWALDESPFSPEEKAALPQSGGDAVLAPFVARRSKTIAQALEHLWADAGPAVPKAHAPPSPQAPSGNPRTSASAAPPGTAGSARPPPPVVAARPSPHAVAATTPGGETRSTAPGTEPLGSEVAIIGMGCFFPGAPSLEAYWNLLTSGRSAIRDVDPARWDPAIFYDSDPKAPEKTYAKVGGFVDDIPFNPLDFRLPPATAKSLDGVQKMALLAAKAALEDAGLAALPGGKGKPFDRTRCAVILGNALGGEQIHATDRRIYFAEVRAELHRAGVPSDKIAAIERAYKDRFPPVNEDTMPGELANVTAGRIANLLDLGGKSHITDAACAASLAAIDAACRSLASGESDLALTGGADRSMDAATFVKFAKIGALSPSGSRPFDEDADGFVQGEGAGILVLKRLADAIRDGDRIYAVVRGIGSSSDGRGKGITAPNPEGQKAAVRRAFESARLSPSLVQYVECHGTGTPVGDPVELESLTAVFQGVPPKTVPVGSVKSQIGHLKSAAGAAALIKAALILSRGQIPPTINVRKPNSRIPWSTIPFFLATELRPLPAAPAGEPQRVGVSAFGFGGTNFHVILESFLPEFHARSPRPAWAAAQGRAGMDNTVASGAANPRREPPPAAARAPPAANPISVFVAGGNSAEELVSQAHELAGARGATPDSPTAALEAGRGRRAAMAKPFRAASADVKALSLVRPGADARALAIKGVFVGHGPQPGKIAFLFPGQGSQYARMLADVGERYAIVKETFDEADRVLAPLLGAPLTSFLHDEAALARTEITQPAVLTADIALLRLLATWGIGPDAVAGHSLGEYAALVAAGVMRFDDALRAVSARGREMAHVRVEDPGLMAAVSAERTVVTEVLAKVHGYVVPANKNSPDQVVIAGETRAVREAVQLFEARGVACAMLPVSAAFHSRIVAPATEPLGRVLSQLDIGMPKVPIYANVHARPYPSSREGILELLGKQVASPVEWQATIENMYADGVRLFVEVGPKRVLAGLVERILRDRPRDTPDRWMSVATNHPKKGGLRTLEDAVAAIVAAGVEADLPETQAPGAASTPAAAEARPAGFYGSSAAASALAPAPAESLASATAGGAAGSGASRAPRGTQEELVVTGASVGLPGRSHRVFDDANVARLLRGDTGIDRLDRTMEEAILEKRIVRLVKGENEPRIERVEDRKQVLHLAGRKGAFDLAQEYGLDPTLVESWDITTRLAVAAAFDAMRDAGIPLVREQTSMSNGKSRPGGWVLPASLRDETGIVFASAWPGLDSLFGMVEAHGRGEPFDRKFLFKILAFGHAQLAELIRARGPCTQVNAACSSTTMALAVAEDWIRTGRAKRVLVVGADDPTSDRMLPWLGAGFLAAGAATTAETVEDGALPFDRRRHGMIVGMGAVGFVVEPASVAAERGVTPAAKIVLTRVANSAFHGSRLDIQHIAGQVDLLVAEMAARTGLSRDELARQTVFISHETFTPARGGSASAEMAALRRAFGAAAGEVLIANTKGYTGHPNGASIEDTLAVKALEYDLIPPIPNLKELDPEFEGLNFARGGPHGRRFALRLSAGFGSQLGLVYFEQAGRNGNRIDGLRHLAWVRAISANPQAELEVVNRTLRVRDASANGSGAGDATLLSRPAAVSTGPPATMPPAIPAARIEAGPEAPPAPAGVPPRAAAAPAPGPSAAVQDAVPSLSAGVAVDPALVLRELTAVVASKTGYPNDVLDPDLDLEADLGIDTVKQAEIFGIVRDQFGLPKEEGFRIKDYPNLRKIASYVASRAGGGATPSSTPAPTSLPVSQPVTIVPPPETPAPSASTAAVVLAKSSETRPPGAARVAGSPSTVPPTSAGTLGSALGEPIATAPSAPAPAPTESATILKLLVETTAEKTGYPLDVLDPTLDLEAELGIDTVKQAEIFGIVRERLGLPRMEGFRLKDYPSLGAIAEFLGGSGQVPSGPPIAQSASPSVPAGATPVAATRAASSGPPTQRAPLSTVRLLAPTLVSSPADPKLGLTAPATGSYVLFDATKEEAKALFLRAKRAPQDLGPILIVRTDLGSAGGPAGDRDAWRRALQQGQATGLAKALARELNLRVSCVDVAEANLSDALRTEIAHGPSAGEPREVVWSHGDRFEVVTAEIPWPATPPSTGAAKFLSERLPRGATLLVTGGAQGIGAACAAALAPLGPRLVLLGRTELPASLEALQALTQSDIDQTRADAAAALKAAGKKATPVAIDKAVAPWVKGRAIAATVANLRALGATTEYVACDVGDAPQVRRTVASLGKVHGIVHASGIEESKMLPDKDEAAWGRTMAPKVDGLRNILDALESSSPPKFVVAFGSVAGRFGNAGQVDYSAANDALAKTSAALRPNIRAVCIDWTAWAETGMATRGSTLKVLEQAGVEALSTVEGVAAFEAILGHLLDASIGPEVVVAKSLPWKTQAGASGTTAPSRALPEGGMLTLIRDRDERSVMAEAALDPGAPWMRDHSIEGTPVLAGVLTLEAFTEAARLLAPEAADFEIRDARFAYAVKLLRGPLSVSVYAERRGGAIHCSASTLPPAPPGVQPARRVHAEATLVPTASPTTSSGFLGGLPPLRSDGDPGSRASTWNLPKDAIYRAFFHGPCFQVLRRGRTLGAATVSAEAEVPPLPAPAFPAGLMEAAFQTLGAWGLAVPRVMALPHKVERIAWSPRARDGKSAAGTVEIYGMRVENDLLVGDAIVRDREGTPMVRAEGIHLIVTGEVAASEALPAPLPPAVSFETIRGRKVARVDIGAVAHDPAAFVPWLPRSEREQASQLHVEKRYVEYVAGGVALRAVGSRRVDGKPDGASLSHAGDWAAALSFDRTSERVGIDVERIEARPDAFLREAFTESERRRLANPTDITRAWCAKEALLKAIGTGLKADLHQIEVSLEAGSITVDASGAVKSAIAELGARNVEFAETAWEGHRVVLATLPLR